MYYINVLYGLYDLLMILFHFVCSSLFLMVSIFGWIFEHKKETKSLKVLK